MLADGGVNAEGADGVHHAAGREAEDESRSVDRPGDAGGRSSVVDQVFEIVVEVVLFQPGEVLVEGTVVGLVSAIHFGHVAPVVFDPRLEAHVLQTGGVWDNRIQDVSEHQRVQGNILGPSPGHVEDVGDVGEGGELRPRLLCFRDVALDVVHVEGGDPLRAGAAGHPIDLPGPAWGVAQ